MANDQTQRQNQGQNGNQSQSRDQDREQVAQKASQASDSGQPGGGQGRRDQVGGSGVYPASAHDAPADSEVRTQNAWGQGDRGAAGYQDSGRSELHPEHPARDQGNRSGQEEEGQ